MLKMVRAFVFLSFMLVLQPVLKSQIIDPVAENKLILVFAGDIMGHDEQIKGAWNDSTKAYNYEPTFRHITDYVSSADIAIANLEVTLAGKPYTGYPQFSSPDALAVAAKNAGFDVMLTANNHSLDRGAKGVERTIKIIDSLGFEMAGTYLNDSLRELNHPLIIEKNAIKLAILNYTYGTNGLTVNPPLVVNRIDTAQIRKDLEKAKKAQADYTIVTVHWGIEYERTENKQQQQLARFMLKHGADAIIGSHPHVIQPARMIDIAVGDIIEKRPVYYSLGNFVSNQRAQYKDGGIMAELHLSKKEAVTKLDSAAYLPYWVYREDKSQKSTFYVIPVSKYESDSTMVSFDSSSNWRFNRFVTDTRPHLTGFNESKFYVLPKRNSVTEAEAEKQIIP